VTIDALRCGACSRVTPAWSLACPHCGTRPLAPVKISGRGSVYSTSLVRMAPEHLAAEAPYLLVMVRLEEGPLMLGRWAGREEPEIGAPVAVARPDGRTAWFAPGDG